MSDERATRNWLFSSSGARPLFLENVVRSLALPEGEVIQYRYNEDLVSESFLEQIGQHCANGKGPLVGQQAYLSYLDNRDKATAPVVYPVREAKIVHAAKLGSTVIVRLELLCFLNWQQEKFSELAKKRATDELPGWKNHGTDSAGVATAEITGKWIAACEPFRNNEVTAYSASDRSHLLPFEETVKAISKGTDFADQKRMFASFLPTKDITKNKLVVDKKLIAGRAYELPVYHYQSGDGTHSDLEKFRLEVSSENEDIVLVSPSPQAIEAPYDEVNFTFRVKDDARSSPANLNISIFRVEGDERIYNLQSRIAYHVQSNLPRRIFFGLLMGAGLFGTQATALSVSDKATIGTFIVALLLALLAGMGAAFQFRTKP